MFFVDGFSHALLVISKILLSKAFHSSLARQHGFAGRLSDANQSTNRLKSKAYAPTLYPLRKVAVAFKPTPRFDEMTFIALLEPVHGSSTQVPLLKPRTMQTVYSHETPFSGSVIQLCGHSIHNHPPPSRHQSKNNKTAPFPTAV